MAKSFHYRVRRLHRYMGVLLGIQFLFWTLGGLYFSWSNMDEIHGDHTKAHVHPLPSSLNLISPQIVLNKIKEKAEANYVFNISLIQYLNKPFYQITYSKEHDRAKKIQLADAVSGQLRPPLSKQEAIVLAEKHFSDEYKVVTTTYIDSVSNHHEYREQPLPAYAITFNNPDHTTVYVASELAVVQKFRNNKWRVFDFLWMMHTMDYQGRDNISNWLLRFFSILGLLTIASGFVLFWVSRRK
jgi:uncharacterized iron-regulated membrane protein